MCEPDSECCWAPATGELLSLRAEVPGRYADGDKIHIQLASDAGYVTIARIPYDPEVPLMTAVGRWFEAVLAK
jgi:hypothetical protein